MTSTHRFLRTVAVATFGIALMAGSAVAQQASPTAPSQADPGASMAPLTDGLEIREAWVRASPMIELAAAAYLIIHNHDDIDDALVAASSPAAGTVEIHQTRLDDDGLMAMVPIGDVPIPAQAEAVLEAGGYHIMLIELVEPLEVGDAIEITLEFAKAQPRSVAFSVLAAGPMSGMDMAPHDETGDDDA